MYLNEKAWEIQQDDKYTVDRALKSFLQIYLILAKEFRMPEIYVPGNMEIYLRSAVYPLGKWLSEADIEYKRLFLSFWQKRVCYNPEEDYELTLGEEQLIGGMEAFLNDSFVISLCLNDCWKRNSIEAEFFSLLDLSSECVVINNVYHKEQLYSNPILDILKKLKDIKLYSYEDLWKRRYELFPHLRFCPSVEKNLGKLETAYLHQVLKKLTELENYCVAHHKEKFAPELLSKTTLESDSTLEKYREEHTFLDEENSEYLAKWHMRFTGIPGRIFFVPEYKEDLMLVCYIGKKLRNVTYPT